MIEGTCKPSKLTTPIRHKTTGTFQHLSVYFALRIREKIQNIIMGGAYNLFNIHIKNIDLETIFFIFCAIHSLITFLLI
jgi:hypothetical protein